MANGKIEFKLGSIDFCGEGEEKWLAAQLDKVLDRAPELLMVAPKDSEPEAGNGGNGDESPPAASAKVSLAKFLDQKNAAKKQIERFLATAEWLTIRGTSKMSTGDVTKALKDNHQPRLANPSDCLNKNVSKGYCEKDGRKFFVTPEGRKSLA